MRRIMIVLSALVVCAAASTVGLVASVPRAAAATDPVVAAAGDIACAPPGTRTASKCHQAATADLLAGADAVLPIGDEQYNCGQLSAFNQVYNPSWGRFNNVSHPAVGDNEYAGNGCSTPGAAGYYTYFGDRASPREPGCTINCQGYYSYDVGSWHVVALNSECTQPGVGGCSATSPQTQWLKADLAAHPNTCTLAYFHRPYFSDKGGTVAKVKQLFTALYNGGADVLLVGHQHIYERFRPQNPSGAGVRERGPAVHRRDRRQEPDRPGLPAPDRPETRNSGTFGVLKLTLHPTSYDWQFAPEAGKTFTDTGTQACH